MQNVPIGVNRVETAILGKVCKSVPVFAGNSGNGVSGGVNRGPGEAGLGGENTPPFVDVI
jgi:hypothetical protein